MQSLLAVEGYEAAPRSVEGVCFCQPGPNSFGDGGTTHV